MSWDSYRDQLVNTGFVQKAAIFGLDGVQWTASDGIGLSVSEVKTIVAALSSNGGIGLAATGILVGGQKYIYITSDDSQVQGKKHDGGVAVAKSKTCILFGVYGDKMAPGNCRLEIEKVKDYLSSVGY